MEFLKTINGRTYYSSDYFIDRVEVASRTFALKDWTIGDHIFKIAQIHKVPVKQLLDVWTRYQTAKVKEDAFAEYSKPEVQKEINDWLDNG